jgi:hypothetical protein
MQQYVDVREHPRRFVILKDHVFPEVERVIAQNDGYVIVEKNEDVSEITEGSAPGG